MASFQFGRRQWALFTCFPLTPRACHVCNGHLGLGTAAAAEVDHTAPTEQPGGLCPSYLTQVCGPPAAAVGLPPVTSVLPAQAGLGSQD